MPDDQSVEQYGHSSLNLKCAQRGIGLTRRPGATLRWRLRNYKNRFWFQEGVKIFCPDLGCSAGAYPNRPYWTWTFYDKSKKKGF